ncbi:MAG: hypothetical protein IJ252_04980 [Solobacterium sp.]|nr:hypothetical protein [Solobacterium sp.]
MEHKEYRTLIDVNTLKHKIENPKIHYYVKDEYQNKYRHLFSISATEENFRDAFNIALDLSNEFDQVAYMDETDMTFSHITDHDCENCHCGLGMVKVSLKWLCYECADKVAEEKEIGE